MPLTGVNNDYAEIERRILAAYLDTYGPHIRYTGIHDSLWVAEQEPTPGMDADAIPAYTQADIGATLGASGVFGGEEERAAQEADGVGPCPCIQEGETTCKAK